MLSIIRRSGSMLSSSSSSSSSFSIQVLVITMLIGAILTPVPSIAIERTGSNRHPYNNHPHPHPHHHDLQPPPVEDDSYRTQESFDTFGGALGPLRAHLEPVVGLLRKDYQGPTTSYDDYHKYGGIGGKKLFPVILTNNNDGYQKHYYGDSEHSDQGLNKYSHEHKRDKYGGKSGNHKDHHDTHVYTRNRGYGYEKHYMFDKEYSTGKSSGSKNGHHSYYGDHDHSNKFGLDMHKNFQSKKFAGHKSNHPDFGATELPLLLATTTTTNNNGYNDYASVDGDNVYGDKGGGGGGGGFLKHKKEFHHLKKHLDHHHHYDHHLPEPISYAAKVQEYVPIVETYGGTVPNTYNNNDDHQFQYLTTTSGGLSSPTYGTIIDPHTTYYTPNAYSIVQQQNLPEDSFYSSSSSQNSRITNNNNNHNDGDDKDGGKKTATILLRNTETEGESINTLNPIQSSVGSSVKVINTAPLISTRLSPITTLSSTPLGGSSSAVAESFARIQSAVHATPPIIATHVYPAKHL